MRTHAFLMAATLLALAALSGCSGLRHYEAVKDADLIEASHDAVADLRKLSAKKLPKSALVVVSTLLNVDNMNKTSAFGRIISGQIASAFHQSGHRITGMEMPIDLFFMEQGGALHLSEEHKKLLRHHQAGVLVGGVYAAGRKNVYVSLRMVDLATRAVIAATDFSVPMGPDAKRLVEPRDTAATAQAETEQKNPADPEPESGQDKQPEPAELIDSNL